MLAGFFVLRQAFWYAFKRAGAACEIAANRAQLPAFSRRAVMANREQRSNREKKKPKADKKGAPPPVKAPAYVEPQLVRKPHKGKQEF
jgi:hypothetical protein